jgi:type IV secretion system protein VirB4
MKRKPSSTPKSPRETNRFAAREAFAHARLPFARHLDETTLETKDGALIQVLHLAGFPFETADNGELNYRKQLREAALRGAASGRIVIYHHVVRRAARPQLEPIAGATFASALDRAWRDRLSRQRMYVNELFITLMRRAPAARSRTLSRIVDGPRNADADRARDRRELDVVREGLAAALEPYGPRLLSAYEDDSAHVYSEPLEAFGLIFNGDFEPALLGPWPSAQAITRRRVSFGEEAIEFGPTDYEERSFAAMLSVKEYPPFTAAGQLDGFLRLSSEYVLTQSFGFVDRQSALERIGMALRRMRAADDDAVSLRQDLAAAKDDVAAARSVFGEHHLTLMVRGDTLEEVDRAAAEAQAAFGEAGALAVRETAAMEPAFWAQFPSLLADIPRKSLISSANMAGLASFHTHPIGQADDNHWGPAVAVLETTAGSPFFFNFHTGDLGNFIVIGPSGSGKTVVLSFLLAQAQRFNPRIVFFDKDRGAEIFMRALGARYDVLRPGSPSGLNPLQLSDTPANRRFLQLWTARLLTANGETLSSDDLALISDAVAANFEQELRFRRLRYFRELFSGARRPTSGDLASRLGSWVEGGDRGWLFDNPVDQVDLSARAIGFDMTRILDDPACRTPAMMYLFHRVEERLDGAPTIIVVDEGWKALDDDAFVAQIRDWEKTIRKRNGIVGFATQSASDALDSKIASAIIEQSATQILMPNPKAQERDYCGGFGLSAHELELVRTLPDTSRCFLIKRQGECVVARLNLSGMHELLTVLSGRETTVRILDDVRAEYGDDPALWLPVLVQRAR